MKTECAVSEWIKTPVANLVRWKSSGTFFARVRIGGKLYRASLDTHVLSVAKLRLADFIRDKQNSAVAHPGASGKMLGKDCITIFKQRLEQRQDITPGAKLYRRTTINFLLKFWPDFEALEVAKITKDQCLKWSVALAEHYASTVYNNTISTLKMILDIAVECRARGDNPARSIKRKRVIVSAKQMPSTDQFALFVKTIEDAGGRYSAKCADLVRFLAFSGMRKNEAANITWGDVDMVKGTINVRVTKNGMPRIIPMIADMKALLDKIKATNLTAIEADKVLQVAECPLAMKHAAKDLNLPHMNHHHLRHLFCTRCIENGVDVSTLARWLGHRDGGSLLLKTYSHLRNEHSLAMAAKVKF